jgi:hypothetical protein
VERPPLPFHPTPYADINAILFDFLARLRALFGEHFLGLYLMGSLVVGDFDPDHSDIDFFVVIKTEINDKHFKKLDEIHKSFAASSSPWANKIEVVYVPISVFRHITLGESHYPQIERDKQLFKAPLEDGWIFQLITLRDYAVTIAGPAPRTFVPPVDSREIFSSATKITSTWIEQAKHDLDWLPWFRLRHAHAFVVLTLCRLLYSLATGSITSKPRAARWAQENLGEPWATLIKQTCERQSGAGEITQAEEDAALAFIEFTFEQSN